MSRLFEPMTIGQLALSNRIVIAPMCQYQPREYKDLFLGAGVGQR